MKDKTYNSIIASAFVVLAVILAVTTTSLIHELMFEEYEPECKYGTNDGITWVGNLLIINYTEYIEMPCNKFPPLTVKIVDASVDKSVVGEKK